MEEEEQAVRLAAVPAVLTEQRHQTVVQGLLVLAVQEVIPSEPVLPAALVRVRQVVAELPVQHTAMPMPIFPARPAMAAQVAYFWVQEADQVAVARAAEVVLALLLALAEREVMVE